MSDSNKLRLSLCSTYLLFQQAAEECPVGPIAAACENLADARRVRVSAQRSVKGSGGSRTVTGSNHRDDRLET